MKRIGILLLGLIFLQGCCNGPREERIYLTDAKEKSIPYKKGQIVEFIGSDNLTYTFEVTRDYNYLKRISYPTKFDGCGEMISTETRNVVLEGSATGQRFELELTADDLSPLVISYGNTAKETGYIFLQESMFVMDSVKLNGKTYYDIYNWEAGDGSFMFYYNTEYGILYYRDRFGKQYTLK